MHLEPRSHRSLTRAALALGLVALLAPALASAKRDRHEGGHEHEESHHRSSGRVSAVPEGRVGTWVIGGQSYQSDRATELDEADGPLVVGACAHVDLRGGRVHEIDSEPESNCQ